MALDREVVTPDARRWRVRRRWVPRLGADSTLGRFRRRFRRTADRVGDVDPGAGCDLDIGEGIVALLGIVLLALFALFVLVPFLVSFVDLLLVLVLGLGGLVLRVLGWRPWVVEATSTAPDGERKVRIWRVHGWRASEEHVEEVAEALAAGRALPPGWSPGRPPEERRGEGAGA